jgi:hypothetical protein
MKILNETLGYLGKSFWGIQDDHKSSELSMDRGELLHRWGEESGALDDYEQSYRSLQDMSEDILSSDDALKRYRMLFNDLLHMLKLRLRGASQVFEFLCEHRMKIELRDLDFPRELHIKIEEFMTIEEQLLMESQEIKTAFIQVDLPDPLVRERKKLLEGFEKQLSEIEDGIEAFYHRVHSYIKEKN